MTLLNKIYFLLLLLTLACYLVRLSSGEKYVRWITVVLLIWLLITLPAVLLTTYGVLQNNLYLYHIATTLEFVAFMLLFRDHITSARAKKNITFIIPAFVVLSILFSLFVQKPDVNNTYIIIIESVLLISTALFFLKETALLQQVKSMQHYPMFWISTGVLFYYTGTLVIEGMLNYLISQSMELARRAYTISYFINYLLLALFIIAAFCNKPFSASPKKYTPGNGRQ